MDNLTPDTNKSLDDLLANPFSVDTNELTSSQQNEIKQFQEKQTAPRLIDRLDANYQEQAKQLASQIDCLTLPNILWKKLPSPARNSSGLASCRRYINSFKESPIGPMSFA